MRLRSFGLLASLLGSLTSALTLALPGAFIGSASVAHADAATSAYVPLPAPTRLFDSRSTGGLLAAGGVATVNVTGAAPLPAPGATVAAVLNVTVVGSAGAGFWTVYPHGATRPLAASLYVDERASMNGDALAIPNLVTVPVGADGLVDVFTQSGGHVVVDMLGSYQLSGATAAGRLLPLAAPKRILDTRDSALLAGDSTTTFNVPNANGATAAVLTATTIAVGPGYWTFFPTSGTRPLAANLNSMYGLQTVANQVIVPLDAGGNFNVYTQTGGHLILDLVALVSGATAPVSTDGLFVPLAQPTRFLDTREPGLNPLGGTQMALPGWSFEVPVATNPAVNRTDVAAVALNVTVTDALANSYVTLSPAGSNDPTSKVRTTATVTSARAAQIVPSHAIVGVSARGFDVFALQGGNVIADVAGYYLGAPAPAPFAAATNTNPTTAGCVGYPTAPVGEIVLGSSKAAVTRAQ